jgi:hypothetical protein
MSMEGFSQPTASFGIFDQHRNAVSRPKDRNESISEIVFHGC